MGGLGQSIFNQGGVQKLVDLVKKGLLQVAVAAKEADMTEEEFSKLLTKSKEQ